MRAAVLRPLILFAIVFAVSAPAHSQPAPGGGVNFAMFAAGSPTPTVGGVDVSLILKPTMGYQCTLVEVVVIDNATGATLKTESVMNPGNPTNLSITGIPSNLEVQVAVTATFQSGILFEVKFFDAVVTTK